MKNDWTHNLPNGAKIDVFGYDSEKEQYLYCIMWHGIWGKVRTAKAYYKSPDKRNEWAFPYGQYFYAILPNGKRARIMNDCR